MRQIYRKNKYNDHCELFVLVENVSKLLPKDCHIEMTSRQILSENVEVGNYNVFVLIGCETNVNGLDCSNVKCYHVCYDILPLCHHC